MRVKIAKPEHFKAAVAFAKTMPAESKTSFKRCLTTLNRIKRNSPGQMLEIHPDWVNHSFFWQFRKEDGAVGFHGGMILHGFQETFSVEINPANYPHWSIHT